jgi:hypothetical protein
VAVARRLASAAPGGSATGAFAFARAWPTRVMVSAGMPAVSATDSGAKRASPPASAVRAASVPPPWASATRASARASRPSVPGFAASHSSALEPVIESRGPT